jgi:putative ABC transport system permease protein
VSDDSYNVDHLKTISQRVIDRIEKNGWDVIWSWVDPNPGSHPDGQIVQAIVLVLGTMGILSLVMSGFLVTNTISALLQRHIRQIGIMKAIGARPQDIMGLYISIVLMYGLLSLLIAVPAGIGATRIATQFLAKLLNFDITSFDTPYYVWGLQILVGLVIPILASLYPILLGARITIREAMANYGVSGEDDKVNVFVRFLKKIQIFPRPVLLSIRNAFRQRGRLLLTLLPLIIGGVIFIAVFSVRASITKTSAEAARYYRYDILVEFDRSYRLEQLQREAMRVPGVAVVEGWGGMETRRVRADGSMGDDMMLLALPAMTSLIDPVLVSGKWLKPEDDNGIVVTSSFLKNEPDVGVGDEIVLRLRGRDTNWIVVGIVRSTERIAYVNYGYFVYANRDIGHVSRLQVVTTQSTLSSQLAVKDLLEARFKSMGLQINRVRTTDQLLLNIQEGFNIIILFLTIMAMLLAVVGGVGLMGAMWLSVLERTREIGVLRAMGASDTAIMQIFVIEGTIIGLLSWPVAVISAIPISRFLSDAVGTALLQVPLRYTFSAGSTLIWFVVILILSVLASFVPARNAAKLSIRETLTYE